MENERKLYLPYLISALWEASFDGALTLMEGDVQRIVLFHQGKPVNVRSLLQEETLGRILLEEGRINADQYQQMLDGMVKTRQPAGEILVAMGVLGPQDVFLALEYQTRKKLLNCFRMTDFGFDLEKSTTPPESIITQLDPAEMVFAGIRSAYSVDRLLTEFPVDEETVFVARPPRSELPAKMGPRENRIHRVIGTGKAMVKLMSIEEDLHQLLSILYALHALHLIETTDVAFPSTRDLDLPELAPPPAPPAIAEEHAPPAEDLEIDIDDTPFREPTLNDVLQANGVNPQLARKVLSLARQNHFEILEVPVGTSGQALKNAFYRLLRTHRLQELDTAYPNPKERQAAQQLLDRATVAFRELEDPESRERYLQAMQQPEALEQHEAPPRILADVEAQKGELAMSSKRYQEAAECFREAIRLYPDEPSYQFQLGMSIYLKVMDETPSGEKLPDSVRKPFLKAVAMSPHYDMPRLYLGYVSKRNGELKRALHEFEGALECNPDNKRARSEVRLLTRRLQEQG